MNVICPGCNAAVENADGPCPECGIDLSRISADETMMAPLPDLDATIANVPASKPPSAMDVTMEAMPSDIPSEKFAESPGKPSEDEDAFNEDGTAVPREDDAKNELAGTVVAGRYRMEHELGRGGFAVVYKAFDTNLEKEVAIKRLLPKALEGREGARMRERFRNEAKAIARLDHPNILRVFDVGEDEAGLFIVMDFINGETLEDHLAERPDRKLPVEDSLVICRAVAAGLSHAHRNKLIHRDIKPSNIMLSHDGDRMVPKVVDFGLARIPEAGDMTQSGMGAGTPNYMPPEQRIDVKNVTHAADVFSLGKVIYVCVTGGDPFTINTALIPPPVQLSELIIKCVQALPDKRFYSMEALIAAMDEVVSTGGGQGDARSLMLNNICPKCNTPNEKGDRFCATAGCGTPLTRNCPECTEENTVHRAVCRKCGTDMDAYQQAVDVLGKAKEFAESKEWRQVLAQAKVAPRDRTFVRGSKGWKILEEIGGFSKEAEARLSEAGELKDRAEKRYNAGELSAAAQLLDDAHDIDPGDSSIVGRSDELRYQALRTTLVEGAKSLGELLKKQKLSTATANVADVRKLVADYRLPAGAEWSGEYRKILKAYEESAGKVDAEAKKFTAAIERATSAESAKDPQTCQDSAKEALALDAESEDAKRLFAAGEAGVAETTKRFEICSAAAVKKNWKAVLPAAEQVLEICAVHEEAQRLKEKAIAQIRKKKQMMMIGAVAAILVAFGAVMAVRPTLFQDMARNKKMKQQLAELPGAAENGRDVYARALEELGASALELPEGHPLRVEVKEHEDRYVTGLVKGLNGLGDLADDAGISLGSGREIVDAAVKGIESELDHAKPVAGQALAIAEKAQSSVEATLLAARNTFGQRYDTVRVALESISDAKEKDSLLAELDKAHGHGKSGKLLEATEQLGKLLLRADEITGGAVPVAPEAGLWAAIVRAHHTMDVPGTGDPEAVYQRLRRAQDALGGALKSADSATGASEGKTLLGKLTSMVVKAASEAKAFRRANAAKLVRRQLTAAVEVSKKIAGEKAPNARLALAQQARSEIAQATEILKSTTADGEAPAEAAVLKKEILAGKATADQALSAAVDAVLAELKVRSQKPVQAESFGAAQEAATWDALLGDVSTAAGAVAELASDDARIAQLDTVRRTAFSTRQKLIEDAVKPHLDGKAVAAYIMANKQGLVALGDGKADEATAAVKKAESAVLNALKAKSQPIIAGLAAQINEAKGVKGPKSLLDKAVAARGKADASAKQGAWLAALIAAQEATAALDRRKNAGDEMEKLTVEARKAFTDLQNDPLAGEVKISDPVAWAPVAALFTKAEAMNANADWEAAMRQYEEATVELAKAITSRKHSKAFAKMQSRLEDAERLVGGPRAAQVPALAEEIRVAIAAVEVPETDGPRLQQQQALLRKLDDLLRRLPAYVTALAKAQELARSAEAAAAKGASPEADAAAALKHLDVARQANASPELVNALALRLHTVRLKNLSASEEVAPPAVVRSAVFGAVRDLEMTTQELMKSMEVPNLPQRMFGVKITGVVWGVGKRVVEGRDREWFDRLPASFALPIPRVHDAAVSKVSPRFVLIPPVSPAQGPYYLSAKELQIGAVQAWNPDYLEGRDLADVAVNLTSSNWKLYCSWLGNALFGDSKSARMPTIEEWRRALAFGDADGGDRLPRSWLLEQADAAAQKSGDADGAVLGLGSSEIGRARARADVAGLLFMRGNVQEMVRNGRSVVTIGGDWKTPQEALTENGSPQSISGDADLSRVGARLCIPINGRGGIR